MLDRSSSRPQAHLIGLLWATGSHWNQADAHCVGSEADRWKL